jgi:hypothetical protein
MAPAPAGHGRDEQGRGHKQHRRGATDWHSFGRRIPVSLPHSTADALSTRGRVSTKNRPGQRAQQVLWTPQYSCPRRRERQLPRIVATMGLLIVVLLLCRSRLAIHFEAVFAFVGTPIELQRRVADFAQGSSAEAYALG